jgi:plasmid maintenance system antidote protein VapI
MKKYTTLSEELNQLSQERKEIIAARTSELRLAEITLQNLREKLGLSSSELADSLELSEIEISDLENQPSLELNTIRNVVNALGGTMEIIIKLPNKEPIMMNLSESGYPG